MDLFVALFFIFLQKNNCNIDNNKADGNLSADGVCFAPEKKLPFYQFCYSCKYFFLKFNGLSPLIFLKTLLKCEILSNPTA